MGRTHIVACLLLVVCSLVSSGCSVDSDHGTVKGQVTFQGEPVSEGQIVFTLEDSSASEGAIIKGGAFESRAPVGNCVVRIIARRVVGSKKPLEGMTAEESFITESYIPKQYNDESTLRLEVQPGTQEMDYLLD